MHVAGESDGTLA